MTEQLTTEQINRLAVEADLGISPDKSELPDTPAVRDMRASLETDIAGIKARGGSVKHYDEFPSLDGAAEKADSSHIAEIERKKRELAAGVTGPVDFDEGPAKT